MAINIDLGSGAGSTNGDTLYDAFTKINTFLSTTDLLVGGDLSINTLRIGKGNGTVLGNTALGIDALLNNSSDGRDNTAIGYKTLGLNTDGDSNTALGTSALESNTTGVANTGIGTASLRNSTTGNNNTALGVNALLANTTFQNTTGLGVSAAVTASDQVQLGSPSTTTYVYGTVQNRSDLRDKADVRDTVLGLDFISKLRAVDYKWDMREDYKAEMPIQGELSDEEYKILMDEWLESVKLDNLIHDGSKKRNRYHHGLIAQEVKEVIEESGIDFGGFQDHSVNGGQDVLSVGYDELIAPMIKAIQELKAEIELLKSK
jgi:hypothetical protein